MRVPQTPLIGKLTVVRPATPADADLLVAWHADPGVAEFWDDETFTREEVLARLARADVDAYIIEATDQPVGYLQGIDTIGTAGGNLAATDQFFVQLADGVDGLNYNYGERPPTTGSIQKGQAAGIGFWNNKNGQALLRDQTANIGNLKYSIWKDWNRLVRNSVINHR